MQFIDQLSCDQQIVWDDILDRQFSPTPQLPPSVRVTHQRNKRISFLQRDEYVRQERRDNESVSRRIGTQQFQYRRFQPSHFKFNIQKSARAISLKNSLETRQFV